MKTMLTCVVGAATLLLAGCGLDGVGDSGAVRAFHPKVKPGMLLIDAVTEGEKAQHHDIRYRVFGHGSAEGEIEIGRYWQEPYIRVTKPPTDPKRPHAQAYTETGYPTREDFARGVSETLPQFYECKRFRFVFGRYQGGLRTDSFEVEVDAQGRIVSVTPLNEDRYD
jgi:hypothetical protein